MADQFGFVSIAILMTAGFIFIKHRRDFRLSRFFIFTASSLLLVASLTHSSLSLAVAALILASEMALLPIAVYDFENDLKLAFKSFITYQLCSHLFLIFAVLVNSEPSQKVTTGLFLGIALFLRLILPLSSKSLNMLCMVSAPWARTLFFLSNFIFALIVCTRFEFPFALFMMIPFGFSMANMYWCDGNRERILFFAQALVCLPFFISALLPPYTLDIGFSLCLVAVVVLLQTSLPAQRQAALRTTPTWLLVSHKIDIALYRVLDYTLAQASFICRRFFGPIIIESLTIRVLAVFISTMRFLSRFLSYAGIPKLIVTSIIASIFALIYVLKV